MKKLIALLLALVMVFALCACGQQAAPAPAAEKPAEAPAAEAPAAEAPAAEEARSSTSMPGTRSSRASSRSTTPFPKA